jgi:hypothetical protein
MLRIPHFLYNLLSDGGEVSFTVRKADLTSTLLSRHFFSLSDVHLCWRRSKSQDLVRLEMLGKLKKFNHLIGSRTRDLPACSILPQPTTLPPSPSCINNSNNNNINNKFIVVEGTHKGYFYIHSLRCLCSIQKEGK